MDKKKSLIIGGIVAFVIMVVVIIAVILSKNKNVPTYVVTFDSKGGTLIEKQTVKEGEKVEIPEDPEREGYMFVEWLYKDNTYDFSLEVRSDLKLVASWVEKEEGVETILFKFDSDGGTTISNQVIEKGKLVTKPADPIKEGYKFLGWYVNDELFNFDSAVETNIEIKAKWEIIVAPGNNQHSEEKKNQKEDENNKPQVAKRFNVKFNTDGGSEVKAQTVSEGAKVTKPGEPTKKGYGFIRWTLNGKPYDFDTKVTSDIELVAEWLKNPKLNEYLVGVDGDSKIHDIGIDYVSYGNGENARIAGWELYYFSKKNPGKNITINGVKYSLYKSLGADAVCATYLDFDDTYQLIARVYAKIDGKTYYSGWSDVLSISTVLKAPKLNGYDVGYSIGNYTKYLIHDTGINYADYLIGDDNFLSGWELVVTSDKNPGNEVKIDGVGYFFHGDYTADRVVDAHVEIGNTYKYRARVYRNTSKGKVYSGWSPVYTVSANLKKPKLTGYPVGNDSDNNGDYMIYDISYDHGTFADGDFNSIVDGWELFVTSDDNPGDEKFIDGVGYFFHGDYPAFRVVDARVEIGRTYKYRARVYTNTSNGKVYSPWSDINIVTGKKIS